MSDKQFILGLLQYLILITASCIIFCVKIFELSGSTTLIIILLACNFFISLSKGKIG